MAVMLLAHYGTTDVDRFLEAFDAFKEARASAGASAAGLVRSLDDPLALVALIEFATREAAEAFAASPARARALQDAGVVERRDEFLEVLRPIASA